MTLHRAKRILFIVALGVLLVACEATAGVGGQPAAAPVGQESGDAAAMVEASVNDESTEPAGGAPADEPSFVGDAQGDAPIDASAFPTSPSANVEQNAEANVEAANEQAAPSPANVERNPDDGNVEKHPGQGPGPGAAADPGESGATAPGVTSEKFVTSEWPTYSDGAYGFRVRYPSTLVAETAASGGPRYYGPDPVYTVLFQQAGGGPAAAGPVFAVQVFDIMEGRTLDQWLAARKFTSDNANIQMQPYRAGDISGIEVLSLNYMSPGRFIYVLEDRHVFRLMPVGEIGDAMLETFMFS